MIDAFLLLVKAHGLPTPLTEVEFAPPRKFRADYVFHPIDPTLRPDLSMSFSTIRPTTRRTRRFTVWPRSRRAGRHTMREMTRVLTPGGHIGILHWYYPSYSRRKMGIRLVGLVAVCVGFCSMTRMFSIFEKQALPPLFRTTTA